MTKNLGFYAFETGENNTQAMIKFNWLIKPNNMLRLPFQNFLAFWCIRSEFELESEMMLGNCREGFNGLSTHIEIFRKWRNKIKNDWSLGEGS